MSDTEHESPITLVDLIGDLALSPEPDPVSMVPQTAGWLVLALVLLGALAFGAYRWREHRRSTAYRRAALAELNHAGDDPAEVAVILRRTALAAYPRTDVAALSGEDWLAFLDRTAGGDEFRSGAGRIIAAAPYRSAGPGSGELRKLAANWIERHKVEANV